MNTMYEAFKAAGFSADVKPFEEFGPNSEIPLPFETPWDVFGKHDTVSQESFEDMNTMRRTWEVAEKGFLESLDVVYGIKWKDILKRYEDKIRIVTQPPKHYGFCCLTFYFEYSYWARQLSPKARISTLDYNELAEKYNLQCLGDIYRPDFNDFVTMQLLEVSPEIVLFCDDDGALYRYAYHAFKFSEIEEDTVTMNLLSDYLRRCDHQPSPNRYYIIETKRGRNLFDDDYVYLRRATPEEIKVAEDLKTTAPATRDRRSRERFDKEKNTSKASRSVNNITLP